jgi:hypothetical protein
MRTREEVGAWCSVFGRRRLLSLETWDGDVVMKLFRESLLARLVERHAISEGVVRKLLAWRHPGFSAHVEPPYLPPPVNNLIPD